jgi:hypothetical protein
MNSCDNLCTVKIHADKIEEGPPHALSRRDIRLIFESVPPAWTKEIKEVRIANSLDYYSHTFFARYDGCLTIYSRNRTKAQALAAVLSELAAISMRLDRGLKRRPMAVRNRLDKIAAPYLQQLLPLIAPPSQSKGHVSLEGFNELQFPLVPNDIE